MLKVGYQGVEGSNSEEASKQMMKNLGVGNYELVPLMNSEPVIKSLVEGRIDYGVIAVRNTLGGEVKESRKALKSLGKNIDKVSEVSLKIHHCLYKKDKSVGTESIVKVVSHIQALRQTELNIAKLLPGVKSEEIEDTAIGAKRLSEGLLESSVVVVCSKKAGEKYGLELIKENIEDSLDNTTSFNMYEKKK